MPLPASAYAAPAALAVPTAPAAPAPETGTALDKGAAVAAEVESDLAAHFLVSAMTSAAHNTHKTAHDRQQGALCERAGAALSCPKLNDPQTTQERAYVHAVLNRGTSSTVK